MTEYEKGYLDGLQAAAMCCEYTTGSNKVSRMAGKIMAVHAKMLMKIEIDNPPNKR